ncbi:hypothetical protein B9Z55_008876 [Caenorhabditis nigoni]|uniref:Uncharacterized protein n=1 Tax=Caenorhabditis nigoni TaxID=1611254 RepID=A0A2G5UPI7_9PELO|nr:hypothetical protein B9Z55_008876 [Caenorhabditis nigoni]
MDNEIRTFGASTDVVSSEAIAGASSDQTIRIHHIRNQGSRSEVHSTIRDQIGALSPQLWIRIPSQNKSSQTSQTKTPTPTTQNAQHIPMVSLPPTQGQGSGQSSSKRAQARAASPTPEPLDEEIFLKHI